MDDSFKHNVNKTSFQSWHSIIEFKRDMKTPDISGGPARGKANSPLFWLPRPNGYCEFILVEIG